MTRKTPPPKPADASPALQPADSLLLADDTPCIEGHYSDCTPYRLMKPADAAPPAPKLPVTIAKLRERIKRTQQDWIDCASGDIALRFFVPHQVADWWNDARMIPGAPPPPPMPSAFPGPSDGPSDGPQHGLAAADVLLRWLAGLEDPAAAPVPPKSEESPAADAPPTVASKEALALALLTDHPEWSDAKIRTQRARSRTSLYRFQKYIQARELLEQPHGYAPRFQVQGWHRRGVGRRMTDVSPSCHATLYATPGIVLSPYFAGFSCFSTRHLRNIGPFSRGKQPNGKKSDARSPRGQNRPPGRR